MKNTTIRKTIYTSIHLNKIKKKDKNFYRATELVLKANLPLSTGMLLSQDEGNKK